MYKPETAFYSEDAIKTLQFNKLQNLLAYVSERSPFYSELFSKNNINVEDIKSFEDFYKIPTTSKDDLQKHNWDFLCVSKEDIEEFTTTSGTMGSPVIIALNENDLLRLAYNEYASFLCADGSSSDIYQIMITLDRQFMAGMAYYMGLRQLRAGIIRLGPAIPGHQWDSIHRLKPTAIVAVPSQIIKLISFAEENKIDLKNSSVKKAICIGESIRNPDMTLNTLGRKITDKWNIRLHSTYAATEMQTAFTECKEGNGCHHQPELLIVEILDENNNQAKPGTVGEVTITTLGVEAMPLLRYRTGDMCFQMTEVCACGRTSIRLSPVIGRKKQLIKLKGTTIYPPALFDVLNSMNEVEDFIVELFSNELNTDEVLLHVLAYDNSFACDEKIKSALQAKLRIIPQIKYLTKDEMHKMHKMNGSRKTVRFIDRRKN